MPWVQVAADQRSFQLDSSGKTFEPWGFNYDHDQQGRLLEDYWDAEWERVEEDFAEMRGLGANVVRIHLQLGKFMRTADEPNQEALDRLSKLIALAERQKIYLNLTGLGCYHKQDVPGWHDTLEETDRWQVQSRFWEAIARRSADSPAIFCYDLMNEPVVPGGRRAAGGWLGPAFAGKHFVQFITLDQNDRPRDEIARLWVRHLVAAIRRHDRQHLVTVGLVPWSLNRPGLTSGFVPEAIVDDLDFISVHIYPEKEKLDEASQTLAGFSVGKPVVVEETFPLKCSPAELAKFIDGHRDQAAGWIGFYWGDTPEECRQSGSIAGALTLGWLELFQRRASGMKP